MTPKQRAILYQNAKDRRENGGQEIMDLIVSSGLPLSSGGMRMSVLHLQDGRTYVVD